MSFRTTAVLLIVLALLAGTVYAVGGTSSATPTPVGGPSKQLLSFLSSDSRELSVVGGGKTTIVAQGGDGKWTLKQPEEGPADEVRVQSMISRLASLSSTRTIDSPGNLADFGLATPKAEAKITLQDGKSYSLLVGDETPDKSGYYVKLPDATSVEVVQDLIGSDLMGMLTNPPKPTPTPTPLAPLATPTPATTPSPPAASSTAAPAAMTPAATP